MPAEIPFSELVDVNPRRPLKSGERYPYVEMAAVPEGGGRPTHHEEREFTGGGSRFAVGDTLFARITPCTENGKLAYVDQLPVGEVGFGSTELIVLAAKPGKADPRFVYQVAASARVRERAISRMLGTSGRQRVPTWYFTEELTIPDIPLAEQRAIAAVLDAVDDTIERTEAVIAATEELRRALLHELLTRGVPGMHSEWKHVPGLGTVPACWEVTTLGEAGRWLSGGTPSKDREDYWRGEIPWISAKDMKVREIWDATDHISDEGARDSSRVVPAGTILMVVRGMILAHSFPLAITRVPCAFNQDLKAVVCREGIVPEYLLAALDFKQRQLLDLPTTSTHGTLRVTSEELFSVAIPLPPREEQERIAATLRATDAERDMLISVREQTFDMKGALADALLTGARRIPVGGASK